MKNKICTNVKGSKIQRGNASQFFVAGELCRRNYVAVVTMGNCPNTDILCSNVQGTKFAHIQVKTFIPGRKTVSVGKKAEIDYGNNFFWILGGIPEIDQPEEHIYYIIPSHDMAKNVRDGFRLWAETPGKKGQQHDQDNKIRTIALPPNKEINGWDLKTYLNRWDYIAKILD